MEGEEGRERERRGREGEGEEREEGRGRVKRGEGEEGEGEGGRGSDNTSLCSWDFVLHTVSLATHSVVKRYSIDCHEVGKVVLVRIVVPVPCNHIKGRVRLQRQRQQKCHITIQQQQHLIKTTDDAYQCSIMCLMRLSLRVFNYESESES